MLQRARLLTFLVFVVILTLYGILEVRLFCIQIAGGEEHLLRAQKLQIKKEKLEAPRGRILDRSDRVLAASIPCLDVYADCDQLENPHTRYRQEKEETLELLSPLLEMDPELLRDRVERNPDAYVALARRITDRNMVGRLLHYKEQKFLRGIHLEKSYSRDYPHGDLMGHTIGFVDCEGVGVFGVEGFADSFLRGMDGYRQFRKDGIQNEIFSPLSATHKCRTGGDLQLTLDATLQLFVEMELEKTQKKFEANWSAAVVLEPRTGRILAAASFPRLDPENPASGEPGHWTNSVFKAEYNPGSSFKPIMMTLCMDSGVVDPSDRIECESGRWRIGRRVVTDVHGGYALLSPAEILVHSSNIGIAKLALQLVPEDTPRGGRAFAPILNHLRLLGLGQRTGVLRNAEESTGKLTSLDAWTRVYTLVSVSFGYEMTVTPIQMAAAFMTLANGGVYVHPRMIESYQDADGNVIEAPRAPSCRVFSTEMSRSVTRMLQRVVEEGSGKAARISGCPVAGKTSTARKDGDWTKHTSSFVAFAPADDPALLVLVVVDEPKGAIYGSQVAAPAVGAILRKALAHMGVRSQELVHADGGGGGDAVH